MASFTVWLMLTMTEEQLGHISFNMGSKGNNMASPTLVLSIGNRPSPCETYIMFANVVLGEVSYMANPDSGALLLMGGELLVAIYVV